MYVASNPSLKLGARALRVIEICKAGGFARYALERSYVGGEKFAVRVFDAGGCLVQGLGYKAVHDAIAVGALCARPVPRSSAWASEYVAIK